MKNTTQAARSHTVTSEIRYSGSKKRRDDDSEGETFVKLVQQGNGTFRREHLTRKTVCKALSRFLLRQAREEGGDKMLMDLAVTLQKLSPQRHTLELILYYFHRTDILNRKQSFVGIERREPGAPPNPGCIAILFFDLGKHPLEFLQPNEYPFLTKRSIIGSICVGKVVADDLLFGVIVVMETAIRRWRKRFSPVLGKGIGPHGSLGCLTQTVKIGLLHRMSRVKRSPDQSDRHIGEVE